MKLRVATKMRKEIVLIIAPTILTMFCQRLTIILTIFVATSASKNQITSDTTTGNMSA